MYSVKMHVTTTFLFLSIRDKLVRSYLPGPKQRTWLQKVCWEPIDVGLAVIVKV